MSELVNTYNDTTIGIIDLKNNEEVYTPLICWNVKVVSYISDPDHSYRAYGCDVKIQSRLSSTIKTYRVYIKEFNFSKFDKVRAAIVSQTHGK